MIAGPGRGAVCAAVPGPGVLIKLRPGSGPAVPPRPVGSGADARAKPVPVTVRPQSR
jgi:hypothetical protein